MFKINISIFLKALCQEHNGKYGSAIDWTFMSKSPVHLTLEEELRFPLSLGPGLGGLLSLWLVCTAQCGKAGKRKYANRKEGKFSEDGVVIDVQVLRKKTFLLEIADLPRLRDTLSL